MGGFKRNFGYERRRGRTVKLETLTGSIFSILLRYFILSLSYFIFWSPILIIFTTHTNMANIILLALSYKYRKLFELIISRS